ncbi:MAG: hypothetical protein IJH20_03295 [Bacilli bacterium]|nr:hypothetical protein [Bacilli bacterium]
MSSPNVVVKNMFTPSFKNLNHIYKTQNQVHNSTMNMFDYYANEKKKAFFMLDYFSGKIGKDKEMNIIFENGEYATKNEIEARKKQYAKYIENSNIYKLVISFPENYLEENVDIKKFEKDLAKDIIPMFLKQCGFENIENMSYQFSLHTNTDNLHFHLSFTEKKPNYKRTFSKELEYRHAGKLEQKELNFLKNEIEHYINCDKHIYTSLVKETNEEIELLKKYFNPKEKNFLLNDKSDILIEEKINKLGKLLEEKRDSKNQRIKFNSIKNKEIRDLTKEIKRNIFSKKDTELYNDYQNFKNSLNEINKYFTEIAKRNHSKEVDDSFIKSKQKYLDNYVLNAIVNYAQYKKITDSKIIQEAVYKEYKKNKKRNKFDILTSYLSSSNRKSQFVSKYKIKEAVRNINDELEQAEKEFENLFKEDKEHVYE